MPSEHVRTGECQPPAAGHGLGDHGDRVTGWAMGSLRLMTGLIAYKGVRAGPIVGADTGRVRDVRDTILRAGLPQEIVSPIARGTPHSRRPRRRSGCPAPGIRDRFSARRCQPARRSRPRPPAARAGCAWSAAGATANSTASTQTPISEVRSVRICPPTPLGSPQRKSVASRSIERAPTSRSTNSKPRCFVLRGTANDQRRPPRLEGLPKRHRLPLRRPPPDPPEHGFSPDQIADLIARYQGGDSVRELAAGLQVNRTTVHGVERAACPPCQRPEAH